LFTIHSVYSEKELIFDNHKNQRYRVEFKGIEIFTSTYVWDGGRNFSQDLCSFLIELGNCNKPWSGERTWESLERELLISVSCTIVGHVIFQVEIYSGQGNDESCFVRANIVTELGQLENIARDAKLFFS
jgi:hypothetical protein